MHKIHEKTWRKVFELWKNQKIELEEISNKFIEELKESKITSEDLNKIIDSLKSLRTSKEELNLTFEDWLIKHRYTKEYEGDYIVGFLDILGFKELLINDKIGSIRRCFETIADSMYSRKRNAYNLGTIYFEPTINNFSDSIIIYTKLNSGNNKERINYFILFEFTTLINDIVANLLMLNIPIRGGVSIGKFFTEDIISYTIEKTTRRQVKPTLNQELIKEFPSLLDEYENFKTKILDPIKIPIHFGNSLTDAYLLESKIKSIGVFMEKKHLENGLLKPNLDKEIKSGKLAIVQVNDEEYVYFNWCLSLHYDYFTQIEDNIAKNIQDSEGKVRQKWNSLKTIIAKLKTR